MYDIKETALAAGFSNEEAAILEEVMPQMWHANIVSPWIARQMRDTMGLARAADLTDEEAEFITGIIGGVDSAKIEVLFPQGEIISSFVAHYYSEPGASADSDSTGVDADAGKEISEHQTSEDVRGPATEGDVQDIGGEDQQRVRETSEE